MSSKTPEFMVRKPVLCALLFLLLAPPAFMSGQGVAQGAGGPENRGPGVVVLDNVEGSLGPVTFDHGTHTFMAESCAVCHHNHGSDNSRCSGCHDIGVEEFRRTAKESFLGCSNCHGSIDPDNPAMPSLKVALHTKCLACHRGMGNIGRSPSGCTEQCHVSQAG